MLNQAGDLTDIGAWYLGQHATGNSPESSATQLKVFSGWVTLIAVTIVSMVT